MIEPSVERPTISWLTQLRFNVACGRANTWNELLIGNLRRGRRRRNVAKSYRTSRATRRRPKFDCVRLTLLRLADSQIRARSEPPRPNRLRQAQVNKSLMASELVAISSVLPGS